MKASALSWSLGESLWYALLGMLNLVESLYGAMSAVRLDPGEYQLDLSAPSKGSELTQ